MSCAFSSEPAFEALPATLSSSCPRASAPADKAGVGLSGHALSPNAFCCSCRPRMSLFVQQTHRRTTVTYGSKRKRGGNEVRRTECSIESQLRESDEEDQGDAKDQVEAEPGQTAGSPASAISVPHLKAYSVMLFKNWSFPTFRRSKVVV